MVDQSRWRRHGGKVMAGQSCWNSHSGIVIVEHSFNINAGTVIVEQLWWNSYGWKSHGGTVIVGQSW